MQLLVGEKEREFKQLLSDEYGYKLNDFNDIHVWEPNNEGISRFYVGSIRTTPCQGHIDLSTMNIVKFSPVY